jgi:hypothetical protein
MRDRTMKELTLDYLACVALDIRELESVIEVERKKPKKNTDLILDAKEALVELRREMVRYG